MASLHKPGSPSATSAAQVLRFSTDAFGERARVDAQRESLGRALIRSERN
jgi:hypothetical protein